MPCGEFIETQGSLELGYWMEKVCEVNSPPANFHLPLPGPSSKLFPNQAIRAYHPTINW